MKKAGFVFVLLVAAVAVFADSPPETFPPGSYPPSSYSTKMDLVSSFDVSVNASSNLVLNFRALGDPAEYTGDYTIYRRSLGTGSWVSQDAVSYNSLSWTDTTAVVGSEYEYRVSSSSSHVAQGSGAYYTHGYVAGGVRVDRTGSRGRMILLMDSTITNALAYEIQRLKQDLAGDGYEVYELAVPGDYDSEPWDGAADAYSVKTNLVALYNSISGEKPVSLYILGHVPVPWSGTSMPTPDFHLLSGKKVADSYYGDMDGTWTDTGTANPDGTDYDNNPGDYSWDQDYIPSDLEMSVGRVDLYELHDFYPQTQTELLRGYLDKAHRFRLNQLNVGKKFMHEAGNQIADEFAFRSGVALNGLGNYEYGDPESDGVDGIISYVKKYALTNGMNYLWCDKASGGGSIGGWSSQGFSSSFFAAEGSSAAFWTGWQSWYWCWGAERSMVRSVCAADGVGLGFVPIARCGWFFHHAALGHPAATSVKASINNDRTSGPYLFEKTEPIQSPAGGNDDARKALMSWIGDPTLHFYPVTPASNLTATLNGGDAELSWSASPEADEGYHVYRATNTFGPFTKLTSGGSISNGVVSGTIHYTDASAPAGKKVYMVRAVKLETTGAGTVLMPAQGVFSILSDAATPVLAVTPDSGALTMPVLTSSNAAVHVLSITNIGGGALSGMSAASHADWLDVTLDTNVPNVTLSLNSAADDYDVDNYLGSFTLSATGADPLTVPVSLNVFGTQAVVSASHDTYVSSDTPTENFGDLSTIRIDDSPLQAGYYQFNMTNSVGAVIDKATLHMLTYIASGESVAVSRFNDDSWDESTLTYDNRPSDSNIGTVIDSQVTLNEKWMVYDVTEFASEEVTSGDGILSFYVHLSGSGLNTRFYSKESEGQEPQLRVTFKTIPDIELSSPAVVVPEGSTNSVGIKLSMLPEQTHTVTVARVSGDTNLTLQGTSQFEFTTNNWSTYQWATLSAAEDDDWADSNAIFECSADGLQTKQVTATEADNDENPNRTLPFTETFEPLTAGTLAGQHGWSGGGTVQTSTVYGGSQALALTNETASHTFDDHPTNVWVTLWAQPIFSEAAGDIPTNASAFFYVDTNAQIVAYSNQTAITLTTPTVSNGWNKFEVFCDYSSKVWKLSLNGTEMFDDFAFYSDQAAFSAIELMEGTAGNSFFDDLEITDSQDDADGDGLPDWWETLYYGGATNANPLATASNGVDTVEDAYIAGINPTNPAAFFVLESLEPLQWTAASGRVYAIYWTSNLLNGFGIPWKTNLTDGAYTDTTHTAENDGFYKIEVELK